MFVQLVIGAIVINQVTQCLQVVALSVARIGTKKKAKLNSTAFLAILKEETYGFVPCIKYSYMYAVDTVLFHDFI